MQIGYVALRKLNPSGHGERQNIVQSHGLSQLREVVSLDSMLCPSVIQSLTEEDMRHKVHEFLAHDFFSDLSYLMKRVANESQIEILAVLPEPTLAQVSQFNDPSFEFLGYELIDTETRIDPLLNCSTFKSLIPVEKLTNAGLISDFDKARQIQKELTDKFPDHVHSETVLFAIWRKKIQASG
jgi:hypothetical protein